MNLITDKWIPFSDGSGGVYKIAPWQVDELSKPGSYIDFSRPDFNLSITMFLIGLVQTLCKTKNITRKTTGKEFLKALDSIKGAFNLFGTGPLFMQDPEIDAACPIHTMFLDGLRKKTVKEKRDFFRKEGSINTLCPSCAAAGLYTLQTFAYIGGGSYYTSPLNNLFIFLNDGNSVWNKIWNNIFDPKDISGYGNGDPVTNQSIFPWLTASEDARVFNKSTYPAEHVYWIMPWRVLLHLVMKVAVCDCCGEETSTAISEFSKTAKCIKYGDPDDDMRPEFSAPHPFTAIKLPKSKKSTKKPEKKIYAADIRTGHNQLSTILYGLDGHRVNNSLKDGKVTISGTAMGDNAAYESWYEKIVPFKGGNKDLIEKMLSFEDKALKILKDSIIYSTNKYEALNQVGLALEDPFYDTLDNITPSALEQWSLTVAQECLVKFNLYATRKYMRNILINKLCGLLKKSGIDQEKLSIPRISHTVRKKQQYLSRSTCSIIMRWWTWLTVYNKTAKRKLMGARTPQDLMKMEEYALSLFDKVVQIIFPDTIPEEAFSDRFAKATHLVLQLRGHNNITINSAILKTPHPDQVDLMEVIRKEKALDILSIYKKILYES